MKVMLDVKYSDSDQLGRYDHFDNPLDAFETGLELLRQDGVNGIQLSIEKERL